MKFGGGAAGAIIGFVLSSYGYEGMDESTVSNALPGIKMLMSWVPMLITIPAMIALFIYPLSKPKLAGILADLNQKRQSTSPQ